MGSSPRGQGKRGWLLSACGRDSSFPWTASPRAAKCFLLFPFSTVLLLEYKTRSPEGSPGGLFVCQRLVGKAGPRTLDSSWPSTEGLSGTPTGSVWPGATASLRPGVGLRPARSLACSLIRMLLRVWSPDVSGGLVDSLRENSSSVKNEAPWAAGREAQPVCARGPEALAASPSSGRLAWAPGTGPRRATNRPRAPADIHRKYTTHPPPEGAAPATSSRPDRGLIISHTPTCRCWPNPLSPFTRNIPSALRRSSWVHSSQRCVPSTSIIKPRACGLEAPCLRTVFI